MANLNAIKARLGAVPESKIKEIGGAIEKILTEDMPLLIKLAHAEIYGDVALSDKCLTELEGPEEKYVSRYDPAPQEDCD